VINIRNQELLNKFGLALRAKRKAMGYSQEELALRSDISISQIGRIETGKINPTLCTLNVIAKGLEINLEELFSNLS